MPDDLNVFQIDESNQFVFSNIYPNETNANSIDTLFISHNGKFLGIENVKSKKIIKNGDIEIITEEIGEDGNDQKSAIFKHVYTIGEKCF